ncbi:MAG: hypothetical protein MJ025_01245 [Victivallaceae bacterium]|nr:hypothetical protein [Victivallaceae bacterium]
MIPKVVHYCWFGNRGKSSLNRRCISSWRHVLSGYEFVEWNDSNVDLSESAYARQAFDNGKWAFVSDYVRLDVLYRFGGIYFDVDVEVLRPFDCFLRHAAFCGQESGSRLVGTGLVVGSEPGNPVLGRLREDSLDRSLIRPDGSFDMTPCPVLQTNVLSLMGYRPVDEMQCLDGLVVYPPRYFCPVDASLRPVRAADAYSVHYFDGSWLPWHVRLRNKLLRRLFGNRLQYMFRLKKAILRFLGI